MRARTGPVPFPLAAATVLAIVTLSCSAPARPEVRDGSSEPKTCGEAAAVFLDEKGGTLVAYRAVERRCGSLEELADLSAYNGEILRLDCVPVDILEIGATVRQGQTDVPHPPADLIETGVCRQYNSECTDYDEVRRDHAEAVRRPTAANRGLYVNHRARVEACGRRYS